MSCNLTSVRLRSSTPREGRNQVETWLQQAPLCNLTSVRLRSSTPEEGRNQVETWLQDALEPSTAQEAA